jgi:ethanolamine utilization protein EutN
LIYYEGGREAAMALDPWFVPVDHTIIGIVDDLNIPA